MKIVMTGSEQGRLIDMAKAEGVSSVKEFDMWLQENRDRVIDMFKPDFTVEYGGEE